MSAEAVATLYMQLDGDEDARRRIAAGELGDVDLDDAERAIIQAAAAEELPEVILFAATVPLPNRYAAIDYIGKNLSSPGAQAQWLGFFDQRQLAHIAPGA
jgi:hypothetical protein